MSLVVDLFSRVGVVLVRPKSPGNVGSVARAMKNMGFTRLTVADPMTYEDPRYFDEEARRMAWAATDLLDSRGEAPDLAAALAGCALVAGTTSKPPGIARVLAPREMAIEVTRFLSEHRSATAALVLGQEDIGLTRDDLSLCHLVGSIPSAGAYPSLNLAQAALLFLYELRLAMLDASPPVPGAPTGPSIDDPAGAAPSHQQLEAFYRRLEETLDAIGFFQGTARAHMMRDLKLLFNRTLMTSRELSILEGVAHRMMWMARRRE